MVKSTSCGLGKSEFIKNKNKEMNGKKNKHEINYIYFPIGGKFKRKNLVDRLLNLPDMTNLNEKFSIHFDLGISWWQNIFWATSFTYRAASCFKAFFSIINL